MINLPETVNQWLSRTRRQHITSQLSQAGIAHTFVASVDGPSLTLDQRAAVVDESVVAQHPWLKPGVVGAALSHVQAYREIVASGDRVGLVLEDDVVLAPGLSELLHEITSHIGSSEIVLMYWRTWPGCEFSTFDSTNLADGHQLLVPMDPHKVASACAYVITAEACKAMIEALIPIRTGADAWGEFYERGGFECLRCVVPRPISLRHDFKSTLDYLDPDSAVGRVTGLVARRRIFPIYQVLGAIRSRREREMTSFEVVARPSPLAPHS